MEYMYGVSASVQPRVELFRLLGDEDRLRLLALCAEEELTVGELAALLGQSQPQITKKTQTLRDAGLMLGRRDGTRTLMRTAPSDDTVLAVALDEGRALSARDGSLSRVAAVVAQREDAARHYFATPPVAATAPVDAGELAALLPIVVPLLPGRALAVDLGCGEGALLPLLSPLYQRVIAIDRSPARLARCAAMIAARGLPNVRLREGELDDPALAQEVAAKQGADLVVMARLLHHAARPSDAVAAAARLLRPGGYLATVDYLPHDDESMREQGDVWLGFEARKLQSFVAAAHLQCVANTPLPPPRVAHQPGDETSLPLQLVMARRADESSIFPKRN